MLSSLLVVPLLGTGTLEMVAFLRLHYHLSPDCIHTCFVLQRCQFPTFEQCQDWLKRLNNAIRPPGKIEDLFSFAYHAWCMEVYASEKEQHGDLCRPGRPDFLWSFAWRCLYHEMGTYRSHVFNLYFIKHHFSIILSLVRDIFSFPGEGKKSVYDTLVS